METEQLSYHLVYNGAGWFTRRKSDPMGLSYRIWLGLGLEPVCLIVITHASDASARNRFAIHRAIMAKLTDHKTVRYFECVLASQRIVTEVYFSGEDEPVRAPRGEPRSLSYLECILGQRVSVL